MCFFCLTSLVVIPLPHGRSCSIGMRMAIWDIENEEEKVALKDGANGD